MIVTFQFNNNTNFQDRKREYKMSLYNTSELYEKLPEGKYAVGAFNVHNMEYTQAAVSAAEENKAPVILMIGEPIIPFAGHEMLANICKFAAKKAKVPVVVALDHGKDLNTIFKSIDLGLSVMFDGSDLPFKENIKKTKKVVERAHEAGVSVEGEIGVIGGSEDGEKVDEVLLTDPQAALTFVEETGVDALAVAIGSCHGIYQGEPNLDINRLKEIKKLIDIPLVLHGGSDLPVDQSKKAITEGIKKFNIGTDLKYSFANKLKELLNREPMPFHPPEVMGPTREAVKETVCEKIQLFGSDNKALDLMK